MPKLIHPDGWPTPKGFSYGVSAQGETLAIAGQIAWDAKHELVSDNFAEQFEQALSNVHAVLEAAGGQASDLIQLTIFVTSLDDYRSSQKELGKSYQKVMGRHFPAMALLEVSGLLEPGALVEIQGLAVLPNNNR